MKATRRCVTALCAGAAIQAGLLGIAFAQGPTAQGQAAQSGAPPAGAPPGSAPSGGPAGPATSEDTTAVDMPVLYVTGVEVLRTGSDPKLDIVRVTGLTSSQGWSDPQLVPTYAGKPADDILDLQFIATAPEQSQNADGFYPVGAIFPLEQGHPFKGVRVRGSENAIAIRQIPGMQQAAAAVQDVKDLLGKKFVAASDGQPASTGAVRAQDLPKVLRVIGPADGIRGQDQNPNRLTLILGDDNTIVEAFWE